MKKRDPEVYYGGRQKKTGLLWQAVKSDPRNLIVKIDRYHFISYSSHPSLAIS